MNDKQRKIIDEARRLPPKARAALAGQLIESLDESVDDGAEAAWAEEIARRAREIDSGQVNAVPWAQAPQEILGRARRVCHYRVDQ